MIRYTVHVEAAQARFASIGQRAAGFDSVLKRWGGYFKSKALKRADAAEGWAPLAESTKKRLRHTRTSNITAQATVRASYGSALERYLIRAKRKEEAKRQYGALAGTDRAAAALAGTNSVRAATGKGTSSADLQELRRLRTAGAGAVERDAKGRAVKWGGSKAIDRLRKRLVLAEKQKAKGMPVTVGGDKRKADGHQLLGRVARSLQWKVEGAKVSCFSKIPWSEVHNAGGGAGNSATEPPREFLAIHDEDRAELSAILLDHLTGGAAAA